MANLQSVKQERHLRFLLDPLNSKAVVGNNAMKPIKNSPVAKASSLIHSVKFRKLKKPKIHI